MSNLKRKKLSFAILDILRKYTDEDHRLSQKDIIDILKNEYDMTADRKSVKRNITSLMEMGYEINFSKLCGCSPTKTEFWRKATSCLIFGWSGSLLTASFGC